MNTNSIISTVGNTPLVRLLSIESYLGWKGQIWGKCEFANPTGSFKDRGSITELSYAKKSDFKGIVCASTGNMAASLALLSPLYQIKCTIFIPQNTPTGKLRQLKLTDAIVIKINGSFDQCVTEAIKYAKEKKCLLCGDYELRRLGQTTIGIEIAMINLEFDNFIVPVGNGTVGCAIAQGLAIFGKFPRFFGVQSEKTAPVYQAWQKNKSIKSIITKPSIASAMNVGNPLDGNLTLDWIKKTKGKMMTILDQEIVEAQKLLIQTEGIFVEPSASATLAALKKNTNLTDNTVLILTGSGLKDAI